MIAIVIFLIAAVYLGVAIWAIRATYRGTRASGAGRVAQWTSAGLVALALYLIPFWDWIPTVVAHHYYCANEATFKVRKPIEQWMKENSEIVATLRPEQSVAGVEVNGFRRYAMNQRLAIDSKGATPVFLAVRREEARMVDVMNGEILAEYVEFLSGYGSFSVGGEGAWKFWLDTGACSGRVGFRESFGDFERQASRKLKGESR